MPALLHRDTLKPAQEFRTGDMQVGADAARSHPVIFRIRDPGIERNLATARHLVQLPELLPGRHPLEDEIHALCPAKAIGRRLTSRGRARLDPRLRQRR